MASKHAITYLQDAVSQFQCLGDQCPDTCCIGWRMQVDDGTRARYDERFPELHEFVEKLEDGTHVMRKDPNTGFCVKFEGGLCSLHKKYGEDALGDACHFYPRSARALSNEVVVTGAMSCPEMARLQLIEGALSHAPATTDRLHFSIKDYTLGGLSSQSAWGVHQSFTQCVANSDQQAEWLVLMLLATVQGLETLEAEKWPEAAPFYLRMAEGRMVPAEADVADPLNVFLSLVALFSMAHGLKNPRLEALIARVGTALDVTIDGPNFELRHGPKTPEVLDSLKEAWEARGEMVAAPWLRRWLHAQLSQSLFPFAGFGDSLSDRVVIIGVRLALLKLCLATRLLGRTEMLTAEEMVEDAQVLARFMDHLADPTMSMNIYQDTGWVRMARLRGLLAV